jgi:hypothetical protein
MSKKYGLLLVMGLLLSGCYTQFAVIHDQPMQQQVTQITYEIDSITGDTIKVVHQVDTITKTKNCYWVRNYWGQPEYHCDGDGYYSSNGYYSNWYDYNDNPWWYRSYSYNNGAFWGYPQSYYGRSWYNGGGGGGGGSYTPSTQSSELPRHSRTYGLPSQSNGVNLLPGTTSNTNAASIFGSGSPSSTTSPSSGTINSGTPPSTSSTNNDNNSSDQGQKRHNPRSW